MKYVILCLAMLCCFALGSPGRSAASSAPGAATDATVEPAGALVEDDAYVGQSCGGNVCGKGQYCCNASCGICVAYGMSCTQQAC